MSRMEDDVKDFLKRIVWSVGLGLFWLTTTLGIGAYNQLLVPEPDISIGNIIFYIWMAGSLVALIWLYYRIWKKKFPHG
jgi:tellurite resistance protein TehA-like permease